MWRPFENGATIGQAGNERGVIVRDDEHEGGARITLERDCVTVPWTVTCGVYGWFVHTRLLSSEAEAEFAEMQAGLAAILELIPLADDPEVDAKMDRVSEAISEFVARFP
jgi:hypothetical protein